MIPISLSVLKTIFSRTKKQQRTNSVFFVVLKRTKHAVELNSLDLFMAKIFGDLYYYYYYDIIKPCISVMMFLMASAALFMFTSGFQCSVEP